jgi:hypothetical protein
MRVLRALFIALFTAFVGGLLAVFVGDYLTQLYHVSEMEGQREMLVIFFIAPLTFIGGFIVGLIIAIVVSAPGVRGFFKAQGLSILVVTLLASLVSVIFYLAADKPPKIDGKYLTLDFEVRVPARIQFPAEIHDYTVSVSLYTDGTQTRVEYIAPQSIKKDARGATFSGTIPILSHAASRELFPSIGNVPGGSQFIPLELPSSPRKENEVWSDWKFATQHTDLSPIPEPERFAARYRVRPVDD